MSNETERTEAAREAAEAALVRIVHHCGKTPEFVVLGGLVPALLCSVSEYRHAGTTDIDVQVNLEIACGATNTSKLETALKNAEFAPVGNSVWRWRADSSGRHKVAVKFELLADLDNQPAESNISFNKCENLGAVDLRGTGFAIQDFTRTTIRSKIGGNWHEVEINVTSVAGFLLAKAAAAHSRRKAKDWYDIAFVLLYNDHGGVEGAADSVKNKFQDQLASMKIALDDLLANFENTSSQGPEAYAEQMLADHPNEDAATLKADAMLAVKKFQSKLYT